MISVAELENLLTHMLEGSMTGPTGGLSADGHGWYLPLRWLGRHEARVAYTCNGCITDEYAKPATPPDLTLQHLSAVGSLTLKKS